MAMYITNFNFPAEFEEKVGEEQHYIEVKKGEISISPTLN